MTRNDTTIHGSIELMDCGINVYTDLLLSCGSLRGLQSYSTRTNSTSPNILVTSRLAGEVKKVMYRYHGLHGMKTEGHLLRTTLSKLITFRLALRPPLPHAPLPFCGRPCHCCPITAIGNRTSVIFSSHLGEYGLKSQTLHATTRPDRTAHHVFADESSLASVLCRLGPFKVGANHSCTSSQTATAWFVQRQFQVLPSPRYGK